MTGDAAQSLEEEVKMTSVVMNRVAISPVLGKLVSHFVPMVPRMRLDPNNVNKSQRSRFFQKKLNRQDNLTIMTQLGDPCMF